MTTDEAESHQKKPSQQEEAGQDNRPPSPEEEQLRTRNRNSASRGLSRLFSSFLKRRSQCESDAGEKDGKEEEAKAPIADPEPELRIEGEVAPDQHSVSSAEAQVSLHYLNMSVKWRTCDQSLRHELMFSLSSLMEASHTVTF